MVHRSYSAVVERNITWDGQFDSEPYEVGWVSEAIFFVRALEGSGDGTARLQITPDGMHWCDEGAEVPLPAEGEVAFCRTQNFGNWLRIVGSTTKPTKVLVTLSLKE